MKPSTKLTSADLMSDFRIDLSGDPWGETMHWWFAVADEIHFNRNFPVPSDWQFRPSPMGIGNAPGEDFAADTVAEADDASLLRFGRVLDRYAGMLRRAGESY